MCFLVRKETIFDDFQTLCVLRSYGKDFFYSIASEQSDDALTSARSYNLYTGGKLFALAA